MPIIQSAKKRVKVAAKANVRNTRARRNLRDTLKAFSAAISGGKATEIAKAQKEAVSALDIAAKKNVIHKNKAARKKAQLSAKAKAAGVKPSSQKPKAQSQKPKTATKKPAVKKTAPKKS
jgi:small subunit ribosomal protein S20